MAIGIHRVQVTKKESTALGGSDADAGVYGNDDPINAQQDAMESAGVYLQDASNRDELVFICRDGQNLCFKDELNAQATLTDLNSSAAVIINRTVAANVTIATDTTRLQAQNFVINDGIEILIEGTGELLVL